MSAKIYKIDELSKFLNDILFNFFVLFSFSLHLKKTKFRK